MALLSGMLYCDACKARMVYGYGGGKDRKYPYYFCLNARRHGRAACLGRTLPAHAIEQSVLARIREAQQDFLAGSEWDRLDRSEQVRAVQAAVERIGFDGVARQISIRFHADASGTVGQEARA